MCETKLHTEPTAIREAVNFRISEDGTLTLRDGIQLLFDNVINIRAIWSGMHGGKFRYFALCGSTVYEMFMSTLTAKQVGTTNHSGGEAEFFYYRNSLYLADGHEIWRVDDGALSIPFGYVPLVGKGWSDSEVGPINEPRNLLNPHARFEYIISERETTILRVDDFISSVEALFINGVQASSDRYSIGVYAPYITVSGMNAGDTVCAYVTYRDALTELSKLKSSRRAYVFGGVDTSRPFLYGGSSASMLFAGSYASDSSVKTARRVYPDSDELYFAVGSGFTVGDGTYPVTSLCRHYDRLLIFTEQSTWQADSSVSGHGEFPAMSINSVIGARPPHGAVLLGNSPYSVASDGVYIWTADTDELNDCNAYCISDGIKSMLSAAFCKKAIIYADKKNKSLYISSPSVSSKTLVYQQDKRAWYTFSGFSPKMFFETETSVGFCDGNKIYAIAPHHYRDEGATIAAQLTSEDCDLGSPERKHMRGITLSYDGAPVFCDIYTDASISPAQTLVFEGSAGKHTTKYMRVRLPRFKSFHIKIRVDASSCVKIHSMTVHLR